MAKELPSSKEVKELLGSMVDLQDQANYNIRYYETRDRYIGKVREALEGLNPILLPASKFFKPVAVHTYFLASVLNEKTARFLDIPVPQVLVNDPLDSDERAKSSRLERALYMAAMEMERRGDGDVWSRATSDAILLDEGVEELQFAPAAFWAELAESDSKGGVIYPFESGKREDYKKERGVPMRSLYIPLESSFPTYEASTAVNNYVFELRTLDSCLRNKLFDQDVLGQFNVRGKDKYTTQILICRYADAMNYAYFLVSPGSTASGDPYSFKVNMQSVSNVGNMEYLYGFQHGLTRLPFNFLGGRYGGWKTQNNRIEAVNKGFLELSQAGDELLSQILTGIRATEWPTLNFEVNPEMRGYDTATLPAPPDITEGDAITTLVGEKLSPIFNKTTYSPQVPWAMSQIKDQLGKLGGSGVLFGENQPGVDTGYHNAQQISQAEHLDEKIEQHLSKAAVDHYTIMMLYARNFGEKIWTHYSEPVKGSSGRAKRGGYIELDPKDLSPLPLLDVRVRKPDIISIIANIRAAREATDDRNGKGPLISDDTARDLFLALDYPDIEDKKTIIEAEKRKLRDANILTDKISQAVNIKLTKKGVPDISPEMLQNVDPALIEALKTQASGQAAGAGGINPDYLGQNQQSAGAVQNPLNRSGGMTTTDSEPEARVGDMVSGAMGAR